jgi:hypothetical protein
MIPETQRLKISDEEAADDEKVLARFKSLVRVIY